MFAARRRPMALVQIVVAVVTAGFVVAVVGAAPALSAEPVVGIEWSTSYTDTETVTVTENATVDGYVGTGTATATATATATGSAKAATWWEVNYYASVDAYTKAKAAATAQADAEARPIAQQRAEDDARAKAAAATPTLIEWSTTVTREETVTVTESATVDGFEGYGTATATATATATGSAKEATWWEVYYWAITRADQAAGDDAKQQADAEARAIATQRAQTDAQQQADAAAATDDNGDDPPVDDGTGDTPPTSTGPSCGPEVMKADGTPWTCTFVDNFRGSELNSDAWTPVETATSRFGEHDCFVASDDSVHVQDGALRLTTRRQAEPFTCHDPDGDFQTQYTSGSVTSLNKFGQTYGRFEIRAAMPATDGPGLHSALWLTPATPTFYGSWPSSGEIDIVEYYSANADRLIPALHYNAVAPFSERTNNTCLVYRPTDFHTYGLEWTTTRLKITIDGTTCVDHTISPLAPLLGSAPFDRPFNINLTQGLGIGGNVLPDGATVDEATMQIDYVRAWS